MSTSRGLRRLWKPRALATPQRELRHALCGLPVDQLTEHEVAHRVAVAARSAVGLEWHPALTRTLHAVAISTVARCGRDDLVEPLLALVASAPQGAPPDRSGDHAGPSGPTPSTWPYAAALRALEESAPAERSERAGAVLSQLRDAGSRPCQATLQAYFGALAGAQVRGTEPLEHLMAEMRGGVRPRLAAFNAMLGACARDGPDARMDDPAGASATGAPRGSGVRLLLSALRICQLSPNGTTALRLLHLAASADDLALVAPLLPSRPQPTLADALLEARLRIHRDVALSDMLRDIRRSKMGAAHPADAIALPSDAAVRYTLLACCDAGAVGAARVAVTELWARGRALPERTVRAVLRALSRAAAARDPNTPALLQELETALFDAGAGGPAAQRSVCRRTDAALHELVRLCARAEWRAGAQSAAGAHARARSRLAAARVAPREGMLATLAYMYAADGDIAGALALLRSSGDARADGWSLRPGAATEAPFVAAISGLRYTDQLPAALSVLQHMALARVRPSLRTRAALGAMAVRMREYRDLDVTPSASAFWAELPMPLAPTLDALHSAGVPTQHAADMVLESRMAALLRRMDELMACDDAHGAEAVVAEACAAFDAARPQGRGGAVPEGA